jgi:molybdenum ABC transporter molybdate-binding protein
VVDGDEWSETPQLTFYCGSVNRRAVEPLIAEFEKREGVRVDTVYNGCGILIGQMKVISSWSQGKGFPDTYMACDRYYLDAVKDQFQDDVDVSETEVVIAIRKGNPKQIQSLEDLKRDGLRLALGQPQQCTIGVLARNILKDAGIHNDVLKNVVAETCSSALLLPMVVTGSVDAALVYQTDILGAKDDVDSIRIDSPAAKAVQPFSIAKTSKNKWLSRRLFETLARHQDQFESVGFRWKLGAKSAKETGSEESSEERSTSGDASTNDS